jgi:ADP-ribose pyrophosphatase YjhB (NUDIX family)
MGTGQSLRYIRQSGVIQLVMEGKMDNKRGITQTAGNETLIKSGAAGAIIQDGKILLVRHNLVNKWQIPGGGQEIGESIQQTVEREIKEELNLDLTAGPLISIYSHPKWTLELPDGGKIQQLTFFFAMHGKISTVSLQTSEVSAYQFFAPGEIPADTFECCKQKVADWMQFRGEMFFR